MKSLKKALAIILSLIIISVNIPYAYADNESVIGVYTGTTTASYGYHPNCSFSINRIVNGKFRGQFSASNLGSYNVNQAVEGTVYYGNSDLSMHFSLSGYFNTSFIMTLYPYEGRCHCITSGSFHFEEFDMYGTVFSDMNLENDIPANSLFDEDDYKICMELCYHSYGENFDRYRIKINNQKYKCKIPEKLNDYILTASKSDAQIFVNDTILSQNYYDNNKDNASYTITYRKLNNIAADMFVVIRGTDHDEWQGNAEITGTQFDSQKNEHVNFKSGEDSIKTGINDYYNYLKYEKGYNNVNLIITGHSRGAAIANLYAKDAIDVKGGNYHGSLIPYFSNITAYTFATPSVAKYDEFMETYENIFNFCFREDIVPTVPLTKEGWEYWKYGTTYVCDLKNLNISKTLGIYDSLKKNAVTDIHFRFKKWNDVQSYYDKILYQFEIEGHQNIPTTLYFFVHNFLKVKKNNPFSIIVGGLSGVRHFANYYDLQPIIMDAIKNGKSFSTAHKQDTYYNVICNNNTDHTIFQRITYSSFNNSINAFEQSGSRNTTSSNKIQIRQLEFNPNERSSLISLFNQYNNSDLLDWDVTDPSSWTGITWNSSGHVTSIDLPYLDLEGTLDLSDFSALENVNVAGNKLTSIDITDCDSLINLNVSANNLTSLDVSECTDLEVLDCSFNNLSTNGLTVTGNTAITSLKCDDCELTTLNVSTLTDLEELSCAFNELTTINVDNNTALTSLTCCYNYMDTHEGGTLYNKFNDLMFSDVYVNYYPQSVPDNATFNTNELNALKAFALAENNNDALDWLDENDNIDTDKLQNNVLFEYDGSSYRVVAVDISDTEVEGPLNLTSLAKLKELYCENTDITSLNIQNCTVLNTLSCDDCEITTLTLPSNAGTENTPLYNVSCEYNHINTGIFTSNMVQYITFKAGATLEYENQKWEDDSALQEALKLAKRFCGDDYTEESYEELSELIEEYSEYENMLLTQEDIDDITADILTAISGLVPYFTIATSCENGTVSITNNGNPVNTHYTRALAGTPITLTATPDNGYVFTGWYELTTKRIFSASSTYTFDVTTSVRLKALFVPAGSATLTFTNDTGQIVSKVTKTVQEWANVTSLSDLLPDVPYKLGHTGGQWSYVESDILLALSSGTDSFISPTYNTSTFVYPAVPAPVNNEPVCNLTYSYNDTDNVCSFIMAAGIPQNLNIEAIGVAFYRGNKGSFNPLTYDLKLNTRCIVSRFDGVNSDGIYIVNAHHFKGKYNRCAKGFITYHNGDDLVTLYTNQINAVENDQGVLTISSIPINNRSNNDGGGIDREYDDDSF